MTVKELIKELRAADPKKEVRFCTIDRFDLELLSVYEEDGIVIIDVGTEEDSDEHNKDVCGMR